ncbi:MAG: hypothetical protein J5633_01610 [Oscillospiraceae bacterium]|nr:hypothetical protein [Oscillospiraceae bacterium]
MVSDPVKTVILGIGSRFVLLDAAMPATAIFYPPILFIVLVVLAALVLLIVALFRRHRRQTLERDASRVQAQLAVPIREGDGAGPDAPKDEYPRQADKKEEET